MRDPKVAIFGTAASYHDMAAQKFYGQEVNIVECASFAQCCEMVQNNHADYAVMAIENSIAGSILSNYELIGKNKLRIIGEQYLKIQLHLLANEGAVLRDIRSVYSHPMALAQCGKFLSRLEKVKILEQGDTASCAKFIAASGLKDAAAIGSERSSQLYEIPILQRNIGDHKNNFTRFIILSKGDMKPEHPDKASLCFRLKNEVGALADVLQVIKRSGITLTKIQSVPVTGEPQHYSFHTDVEWENYNDFCTAMKKIQKHTSGLAVLGEYLKANIS